MKFNRIPEGVRPTLYPASGELRTADGGCVIPEGYAFIPLKVNGLDFLCKMVIASVDAPAVIGYDFLFKHECDIDVRKGLLTIGGNIMKCQRESQLPKIFRVSASETVVIPPFSEAIIKGNIKGDMSHIQQVIIEPLSPKLAEMGLIVGKSVVHTDSGQVPLRVLNPGSEEIKLYKHTDTATCEVAKRIIPVLDPGIPVAEVPDTLRNIKTTENDVHVPNI